MPEAVNVEVFPKQVSLKGGYGSLVKLPLGIHRVTGRRCLFLDENFNPYKNQNKSGYGDAQIDFLRGVNRMSPETLDELVDEFPDVDDHHVNRRDDTAADSTYRYVKNPIKAIYEKCNVLREMKEKAHVEGHLTHQERHIFAGIMIHVPGGTKEVYEVLSNCKNYDEAITRKQLEYITQKGISPFTCGYICGLCKLTSVK